MKNEEGISVFLATGELRDQRKFLYSRSTEFFCIRDRRNFFWSSRSTEFWNFAIDGIFVFAIDGILWSSRATEFLMFASDGICYVRDRRNFYFRDRRIKRSNQAIVMSDGRIKWSIIPETLKFCDREFSRNWNSGIPEKKRKKEGKKSNEPFFKSCMGNTLQRGPEED